MGMLAGALGFLFVGSLLILAAAMVLAPEGCKESATGQLPVGRVPARRAERVPLREHRFETCTDCSTDLAVLPDDPGYGCGGRCTVVTNLDELRAAKEKCAANPRCAGAVFDWKTGHFFAKARIGNRRGTVEERSLFTK